jgi:spore coat protein CotH
MLRFIKWFACLLLLLNIACKNTTSIDLPTVFINTTEPLSFETEKNCQFIYVDQQDSLVLDGTIKWRGGFSVRYEKHSFALELSQKAILANLAHDDDWILNANYIDKTFMRHTLSFDLYRRMNARNIAAKCAYVNVYQNNQYLGLYVLMEKINGGMVELDKGDPLAMIFKDPPIFYQKRPDSIAAATNYYQQKFPKIQKNDLSDYIEQFMDFLNLSTDEAFKQAINTWVDIPNIIDWHLLLLLSNNNDGVMKNFYLYKRNAATPFRIAIWDYDHSFGRDGDNELNLSKPLRWKRSILLKRLVETNAVDYKQRLKERWISLRKDGPFALEALFRQIEKNNDLIKNAVLENNKIWPVNSKWYYDDNDYETEVELMKTYLEKRIPVLDQFINEM